MLRKLVLGLAAVAALSTTAMISTEASAKGWKGGWHHHHHHGHWGGGYGLYVGGYGPGYGSCYVKRLVPTPYGMRYRVVNVCY
jgi:hypothetical protein